MHAAYCHAYCHHFARLAHIKHEPPTQSTRQKHLLSTKQEKEEDSSVSPEFDFAFEDLFQFQPESPHTEIQSFQSFAKLGYSTEEGEVYSLTNIACLSVVNPFVKHEVFNMESKAPTMNADHFAAASMSSLQLCATTAQPKAGYITERSHSITQPQDIVQTASVNAAIPMAESDFCVLPHTFVLLEEFIAENPHLLYFNGKWRFNDNCANAVPTIDPAVKNDVFATTSFDDYFSARTISHRQ